MARQWAFQDSAGEVACDARTEDTDGSGDDFDIPESVSCFVSTKMVSAGKGSGSGMFPVSVVGRSMKGKRRIARMK